MYRAYKYDEYFARSSDFYDFCTRSSSEAIGHTGVLCSRLKYIDPVKQKSRARPSVSIVPA